MKLIKRKTDSNIPKVECDSYINEGTAKYLFMQSRFRSRNHILICKTLSDANEVCYTISASAGSITQVINLNDKSSSKKVREIFKNGIRAITPLLLNSSTKIIGIVCDESDADLIRAVTELAYSISATINTVSRSSNGDSILVNGNSLYVFMNGLPSFDRPICGDKISTNAIATNLNNKPFYGILSKSEFVRNLSVQFAIETYVDGTDNPENIIYIVGYNPTYVTMSLETSGFRTRFIEKREKFKNLILPKITSSISMKSHAYYQHDDRMKLSDIDALGFSLSNNVIYLGINPGYHLDNWVSTNHRVLGIDPSLNDDRISQLRKAFPNGEFLKAYFNYDVTDSSYNDWYQLNDLIILDDTYVEESYDDFQIAKMQFYNYMLLTYPNIKYICLKWNYHGDIHLSNVVALLPQPHGGMLQESRIILGNTGGDYHYIDRNYRAYMSEYAKLALKDQLTFIKYYHELITLHMDALDFNGITPVPIVANFALSNVVNTKYDVLKWCQTHGQRHYSVINLPNKHRLMYASRLNVSFGVNVKLKDDDTIMFKSPSIDQATKRNKVWYDNMYTPDELSSVNYMQVTYAQLLSYLVKYTGYGYMFDSRYIDMWDTYIPKAKFMQYFRIQNIGNGPFSVVKSYTNAIKTYNNISNNTTYHKRGELLHLYLRSCNVKEEDYEVVGSAYKTVSILNTFKLTLNGRHYILEEGTDINVSGHMMSITIASHFVPTSIEMWLLQLVESNKSIIIRCPDRLIYADLNMDYSHNIGILKPWHTLIEILLTCEILHDYVRFILGDIYSRDLVENVIQITRRMIRAI